MKTRVVEILFVLNVYLPCVIHNAYMHTLNLSTNGRSLGRPPRSPSRRSDGFEFGHITHRREHSLRLHTGRDDSFNHSVHNCTLTPTVPLCASICAHAHYMPMHVDVECAELFDENLYTLLCRHGAVTSNDSQPNPKCPCHDRRLRSCIPGSAVMCINQELV